MDSSSPSRSAVVTGASRGLGAEIARQLAQAGHRVVLVGRSEAQLKQQCQRIEDEVAAKGRAVALCCDLRSAQQIEELLAELRQVYAEGVDILVNNAGVAESAPVAKLTAESWESMMQLNARAPMLLSSALIPGMRERGFGRVINVASVAGLRGAAYISIYAASKHALVGLSRSMAEECRGTGVAIHALCPGYVDTPMVDSAVQRLMDSRNMDRESALKMVLATAHQRRLLSVGEVAQWAVHLAGSAGDVSTGACVELLP